MREKRDGQKERERRGRNREREEERGRDNFVKREVKEGCKGGGSARERERENEWEGEIEILPVCHCALEGLKISSETFLNFFNRKGGEGRRGERGESRRH